MTWIRVQDKLPANDKWVLVATNNEVFRPKITIGYYSHRLNIWSDNNAIDVPLYVTHWMPLPEPPMECDESNTTS